MAGGSAVAASRAISKSFVWELYVSKSVIKSSVELSSSACWELSPLVARGLVRSYDSFSSRRIKSVSNRSQRYQHVGLVLFVLLICRFR